jgi:hypothetical protein
LGKITGRSFDLLDLLTPFCSIVGLFICTSLCPKAGRTKNAVLTRDLAVGFRGNHVAGTIARDQLWTHLRVERRNAE